MTTHNSISSNAFNSTSFVSNGVDPRTGQYTVTINLPELNGNLLSGPALPLGLSFSPINTHDSGFGTGWDLSLTQFNPTTRVLSLASGEAYKVTGTGAEPEIAEKKLDTFRFFDQGAGRYQVVHKNGQVEMLEHRGISGYVLALPVMIQSPEGHALTLSYQSHGNYQRLREVRQADGRLLLTLAYSNGTLNITYLGGENDRVLATYLLQMGGSSLSQLIMPTSDNARWRFEYEVIGDYTCLKSLRTPQGAVETIENDGRHPFPNSNKPGLPRVTRHVIDPGRDQPPTETRYTYSIHNFLGNGATSLTWREDGLDNLYRVTEAYQYSSTQTRWHDGVAGRTITSSYNRYHLLTEQVTTHGNARLINATEYHLDDTLPFDLQAPQCQMPYKTLTRWTLVDDPTRVRDEVQISRFDSFGNKIEQIDASGVRETWSYYSALGEPGCPPDPYGFCRQVKEHRRYPAKPPSSDNTVHSRLKSPPLTTVVRNKPAPHFNDEPVMISRFTYTTHPPLAAGPVPTLVLDRAISSAATAAGEQVLLTATHRYYDCPQVPERHGKPHTVVEDHNGYSSCVTHDYDYQTYPSCLTHKQRVSHDLDGTASESLQCFELYTGLLLEEHTAEGRILRNEYDATQRILSESVTAADSRYPANRRYSYSWPATAGRFAEHRVIDAEGVESVEELDGLQRTIRRLRHKADGSADDAQLRLTYSAHYNHEMQLLRETRHDWLDDQPLALDQHYEYDEWDQRCREVDASGIATHTLIDPFTLTITEWQDGMARTVTRNNLFGKPQSVVTYPADPGPEQAWLTRERSFYDGYGQLRVKLGNNGGAHLYDYDVLGRLINQQLPDRTRIAQRYAEHSQQPLVTELHVIDGQRARAPQLLGSRRFDGLERVTQWTVGPRTTQLRYRGNLDVIDEQITPAQQSVRYEYELGLSNEPTATHADESCTFEYHPLTAALIKAHAPQSTLEYHYDRAGQLAMERSEVNGTTREVTYRHSLGGRLQQRAERIGAAQLQSSIEYDAQGRVRQSLEGQLRSDFEYNLQGLLARTTTQDLQSANTLVTELEYDDRGRETVRTQRLTASAEHRTVLTWAPDGHLQRRERRIGAELALDERFVYDLRGRLTEHAYTGPDLPADPYGNLIVREQFDFDGLDNLTFCTRYFADGSEDEARHFYADDDPCQLRGLTHTHPDYPAQTLFSYDADGNMAVDANGRQLQYDRQGRLLQVNNVAGAPLSRYRYDAHDHLLGVTRSMDAETLRFYQGTQVRSVVDGEHLRSFSYAADVPIGQQQVGAPEQTLLTLCGETHSVLAELRGANAVKRTSYTSYGDTRAVLESRLGFNGELREADTGWYLLGKGYRAYDPQLRRFHSPDNAAPFGAGGLNHYGYCLGDPIGFSDPTGHFANPREDRLQWEAAMRTAARKNALMSLGIGALIAVVSAVVFLPFAPGAVGFAVGLGVEMAELSVRTAVNYSLQAKGETTVFWDFYDGIQLAVGLIMVAHGVGRYIKKKLTKFTTAAALAGNVPTKTIPPGGLKLAPDAPNVPRRVERRAIGALEGGPSGMNSRAVPRMAPMGFDDTDSVVKARIQNNETKYNLADFEGDGANPRQRYNADGIASMPEGGADLSNFSVQTQVPKARLISRQAGGKSSRVRRTAVTEDDLY
jgi:RHS repeat-associated protein